MENEPLVRDKNLMQGSLLGGFTGESTRGFPGGGLANVLLVLGSPPIPHPSSETTGVSQHKSRFKEFNNSINSVRSLLFLLSLWENYM